MMTQGPQDLSDTIVDDFSQTMLIVRGEILSEMPTHPGFERRSVIPCMPQIVVTSVPPAPRRPAGRARPADERVPGIRPSVAAAIERQQASTRATRRWVLLLTLMSISASFGSLVTTLV